MSCTDSFCLTSAIDHYFHISDYTSTELAHFSLDCIVQTSHLSAPLMTVNEIILNSSVAVLALELFSAPLVIT